MTQGLIYSGLFWLLGLYAGISLHSWAMKRKLRYILRTEPLRTTGARISQEFGL